MKAYDGSENPEERRKFLTGELEMVAEGGFTHV
jgi:hypothetical protein